MEIAENIEKFQKAAADSAKELETINTKVYEQLFEKQRDFVNNVVELGTKYVETVSAVKGVQEILSVNMNVATEYNETLAAATRDTADIISASREDYQGWFEKGMKTMQDVTPEFAKSAEDYRAWFEQSWKQMQDAVPAAAKPAPAKRTRKAA